MMAARHATATFKPDGDMPSEFSAVDVDVVSEALDFTAPMIGILEWEEDASTAHALLAGHMLKRLGYGSNRESADPTHSRSVGPVSVGPNPSAFQGRNLLTTVYGRQFQMLFESRAPSYGVLVV